MLQVSSRAGTRKSASGLKRILATAYGHGIIPFAVMEAVSKQLRRFAFFRNG
jgi:hypothetical protein